MINNVFFRFTLISFFFISLDLFSARTINSIPIIDNAPIIKAVGDQVYCPRTSLKIVTDVTIIDSDNTGTDAVYIQISSGYSNGQDQLTLINPTSHPTVIANWNALEGKLKISSSTLGTEVLYTDFIAAIKDVEFSNSSASPSGIKNFSITIGQANYLPRNGHFYEFVSDIGIKWTDAKLLAEQRTYYGLQGYLVTITDADEEKISSEQTPGTGWIGGSDEANEGVWKWVTGPENGTVFWMGGINGYATGYVFWNNRQPDNARQSENYAHITDPNLPGAIRGSWNDLSNEGGTSSYYLPKGYIVEYGGMPDDPVLEIAASTRITIPQITSTIPNFRCGSGSVILGATARDGIISWYDSAVAGNLLATGDSYITPELTNSQTYYVDAGCSSSRVAITATIYDMPTFMPTNATVYRCGSGSVKLEATTSAGIVNWYATSTGGSILATGTSYIIANVTQNATYYVEATNNGCSNGTRKAINIVIYTPPVLIDQEIILCKGGSVILDALLSGMTYLWSTGETSKTIVVTVPGIYTVNVSSPSPENCTSTKAITVVEHIVPEIKHIDVNETTVVIYLNNSQPYFEYSIDGINYQTSNVFFNAPSGLQTAYVREINSCSIDTDSFIVLIVLKFFTPNGDNYNDSWEVKGLVNYPNAEVTVFDRYGKLITKLNLANPSWDGTFNTNLLPASDYWYTLKIDSSRPERKGHFSLKR